MEELTKYIERKLKEINKAIDNLTKKQEREVKPKEREKIQQDLIRFDACFEAYMTIYKKIKRL